MKRRTFLVLGASAVAYMLAGRKPVLADLEPDGMWSLYRRYRLLIVGQRDDELASAFAEGVAGVLSRHLPASRARIARAADTRRVGVLIGTEQQDVAIMEAESATALFLARPPFDDIRGVPLRLLVSFGTHVLVCKSDFMARHAYLVAQMLTAHKDALPTPANAPTGIVSAHPGAHAFFAGAEMPNE